MPRSIKVRKVFAELRQTLGADIPAGELLLLAATLVDATAPIEDRDLHKSVGPRPAPDVLPLDEAFEDGGWRIMECERPWVSEKCGDDDPGFAVSRGVKRKVELSA